MGVESSAHQVQQVLSMAATGRAAHVLHMITQTLRSKFDPHKTTGTCREDALLIVEDTLCSQDTSDHHDDEDEPQHVSYCLVGWESARYPRHS